MVALSLAIRKMGKENHNKFIILRPMYQYNFYERRKHIQKIIYASDSVCKNIIRMNKQTFVYLFSRLEVTGIVSSTKNMLVDKQVAMTVHILAHHQKQRIVNVNFEWSEETINRHFKEVLNVIITLQRELLKTSEAVPNNSTYERWKWFKGCLIDLDGTHIKVRCARMICNVIYVLPSWEGPVADGRVLRDAISRRNGLVVPHGQRYHLNDWSKRHQPTTAEEFLNMKYSSTRNIIERLFDLLKSHWRILRISSYYPIKIQNRITMTCCLLYNFIRQEMGGYQIDDEDNKQDEEKGGGEHLNINEVDEDDETITIVEPSNEWTTFRKNLAINIFNTWRAQRNPR
ncbi:hypothetical protein Pfo_006988 [Paulownia fortunei]|nr:hypothetical protein Pfo_006988 [Paulownia fortunei]